MCVVEKIKKDVGMESVKVLWCCMAIAKGLVGPVFGWISFMIVFRFAHAQKVLVL